MSLRRTAAMAAACLTLATLASGAWASPWVLKPGEFYTELSGSSFSANTFHSDNGDRLALLGKLDQRELRSYSEFGWKKRAAVWFDIPCVNRGFTPYTGSTSTSTGLGDLDLGAKIRLKTGSSPLALTIGWTTPMGGNRKLFPGPGGSGGIAAGRIPPPSLSNFSDTSFFFNQGLQSLTAGLELGGTAGKRAYWNLGGSYRYTYLEFGSSNDNGHNARLAGGRAELGIWFGKALLVSGELDGEWLLAQSAQYDQDLTEDHETHRLLAGPRLTYRVDDRMDVFAGSMHVASGRNTLHYDQYYAGIAWKQTGLSRLAGALGGMKEH